jgi:hypothetical protein
VRAQRADQPVGFLRRQDPRHVAQAYIRSVEGAQTGRVYAR